jgi:hypothetical protein
MSANNENLAIQIAKELNEKFKAENYFVTEIAKGNFNYNFQIKNPATTLYVQVYYGKKGCKVVLQGNSELSFYKEIYNKIFSPIFENQSVDSKKKNWKNPNFTSE